MFAMISHVRKLNVLPLLLAVVMCACSPGAESPNPPATSNSQPSRPETSQPVAKQPVGGPAPAAPPVAAPQPQPAPALAPPKPAPPANAPRLLVAATKIDFGKQPKDKTISRSIVLKNVGKSELKIESVVPS